MEDERTTEAIMACKSFDELEEVINKHAPIISYSRNEPVSHSADHILRNINMILNNDWPLDTVTKACGLRFTVEKLLKEDNK